MNVDLPSNMLPITPPYQLSNPFPINGLSNNTTYYRKVVADNGKTSTIGQVWRFSTPTIILPPGVTTTTAPTTNPSTTPSQNIAPSQNDRRELPQLMGVTYC